MSNNDLVELTNNSLITSPIDLTAGSAYITPSDGYLNIQASSDCYVKVTIGQLAFNVNSSLERNWTEVIYVKKGVAISYTANNSNRIVKFVPYS